jgi:UDP-N-acetylmuramoyl-tripeptide--D-alanyl-D-alanine ligase
MCSALDILGAITPAPTRRRIAVLGDMLELGDSAPEMHGNLLDHITRNNIDLVFACGPLMENLWIDLPEALRGGYSIDPEKLSLVVASILQHGDVVMIKGSLGSRLSVVVDALLELGEF